MRNLDLWFYVTVIVGMSLLYYGYENKKKYNLKEKELELEHKKIDLEIKKVEKETIKQNKNDV